MRFVLIDKIELLEHGNRAVGYKHIAPDEEYFRDHFPGYPIVPGVLILESLAQLGGRLVEASIRQTSGRRVLPLLAKMDRAKLLHPVRPGDRLDLAADVVGIGETAAKVAAVATVQHRKAATVDIMYAVMDLNGPDVNLGADQARAIEAWSDRVWRELRGA
jgi:3-hydroxyacyl-[acyl-carrier-protein] dehydratase